MNKCSQTKISRGFSLIIDDSGQRKSAPPASQRFPQRKDGARSGNFTAGVGRQYIGEIGKTDNGNVVVTTHLYDGKKSLPLDIELYQQRHFAQLYLIVLSNGSTKIVTYLQLIKRVWALFGLDFC